MCLPMSRFNERGKDDAVGERKRAREREGGGCITRTLCDSDRLFAGIVNLPVETRESPHKWIENRSWTASVRFRHHSSRGYRPVEIFTSRTFCTRARDSVAFLLQIRLHRAVDAMRISSDTLNYNTQSAGRIIFLLIRQIMRCD